MTIQEIANKYAGESCQLDGLPAVIQGRLLPFAHVRTIDMSKEAEYSWQTILLVMENGGGFKT